jgi:hypothetical protein
MTLLSLFRSRLPLSSMLILRASHDKIEKAFWASNGCDPDRA